MVVGGFDGVDGEARSRVFLEGPEEAPGEVEGLFFRAFELRLDAGGDVGPGELEGFYLGCRPGDRGEFEGGEFLAEGRSDGECHAGGHAHGGDFMAVARRCPLVVSIAPT